ncbi:hypothetical protein N7462_008709 [Penicillium macrosclerotiorum]|uniref:uncharacterized protein n=1 Tax=Penicillium macrosclerotiorum TaxID=303699 RepID=UPI0025490CE2|nr:uncharacterized protein N7462_008709 [Penicillium macrosclerotiorum]KAJ5675812.1 hypothetical protein N7462_008709 [Penicillium macrosclerotiorum]
MPVQGLDCENPALHGPDEFSSTGQSTTQDWARKNSWSRRWMETVDATYADWPAYHKDHKLTEKTGNTIVLGLGASHQPNGTPNAWIRSLVSIASFIIGAVFFARLTHYLGPRRRKTLVTSFALQTILIVVATILIQTGVVQKQVEEVFIFKNQNLALIPIALLAFQSAGTINSTRVLGFNEIPGVVLTSVYYDLASDGLFFESFGANRKRNRRLVGAVMLLTGAICGGWLSRSAGGMALSLWLAAFLKFMAGLGWVFWSPEVS